MLDDTICAPATPPVHSPIGIIRISGPDTIRAVSALFSPSDRLCHRRAAYGSIMDNGSIVDDVIAVLYKSPSSFTGEDMAEICCHGNPLIVNRILSLLHREGVRFAQAGEFSKRSFLNGKIDLTGAEAINHIISARSQCEIDASVRQMHGSLRNKIGQIRHDLITLKADIECAIDFAEEEVEFVSAAAAEEKMSSVLAAVAEVRERCALGDRLSRGIDLPIVGKPNVGKSSILNLILNSERALVSDIPGTTRDTISESVQFQGVRVNLIDTAGIDTPTSVLERMGIELSDKKIETSSLVLFVADGLTGLQEQDRRIMNRLGTKNRIYLINKIDIAPIENTARMEAELEGAIHFSAKTGVGLNELERRVSAILNKEFADHRDFFMADARMAMLLDDAIEAAETTIGLIRNGEPQEITAFQINHLLDILSGVIGDVTPDDILNSIFDRFCIGK